MKPAPFILASASPRRSRLLADAGIKFTVISSDVAEMSGRHLSGCETARVNAYLKARAVAEQDPKAIVLGADTVVCLGARLFGKPADLKEARSMLRALSGQAHQVVSGCCLMQMNTGRSEIFHECTRVTFRRLSRSQIDRYLESIEPLDKAGAYAIQDHGEAIVEAVHGSLTNVVGLPLTAVCERLARFGVRF
jgi:septum formation protein